MRYALLVSHDENADISQQEAARRDAALAAFLRYAKLTGVLAGAEQFHPASTATTVRAWDGGDVIIGRGSSPRPTEHLSAIYFIEGKNLDEAVDIATRIPAAWFGTVEVRQALSCS
jgi:hypothetical protein